jgi:sugar phosphate isomerase/epimerase
VGAPHTSASLLAFIEAKHDRISSMHIKDRTSKEHGAGNLVWGSGDTPLKEVLTLLKKNKYKFPATIELEYEVPAGSTPVEEVKKCVAYAKNILA